MKCFPCAVAKRAVELRLAAQGADPADLVAAVAATQCVMCSEADRQQARRDAAGRS